MPDQVQGQGVQDAPPPVPTVVPTVALPADAVARLLNVLEALVPTQGESPTPQATLQTQAPVQTQTFENKDVSLQEFLKLKSPKFTGSDNPEDPQSFLDGTLKALRALGCSSERVVELATYKLEDISNTWYETVLLGRPVGAAPLTWDEFTKLFMNHFLPDNLMQKYARDFKRLVQTPDMDVSKYNTKFCKLARYAPYLVPTEESRVQRFVDGLVGRLYIEVALQMKSLSYSNAVDLSRKIETKGREERAASDLCKKAKIEGSFSGGFSENRRAGNQGQQQQGSQTGTHLASRSTYRPHYRQGTRGPSSSGHHNSEQIYATTSVFLTCGATGSGNRGRGAGDRATVNQGQGNAGRVATPVEESLLAEYMYRACQIRVEGRDTLTDLIVLDMID
ncbi:uncharacterized protein [Nicotiana tomentosiformis]|uniref:uncharacterized protein n=1 Tax=Nicotiana tomentosiformis TaxID=4098 RepID=UPI00388C6BCB